VIDFGDLRFARSAAAALSAVFDHVAVLAPPPYLEGDAGGNFVLVSSASPIDIDGIEAVIAARGGVEVGLSGPELASWIGETPVLRDDFAPVDQMLLRRGGP
jgi:hypothetical protein